MIGLKYCIGLDLGQQNDYTVLSIMEVSISKSFVCSYVLRYVKRYPLKTNYDLMVNDIVSTITGRGIQGESVFVLDYSGVGRPVFDLFTHTGLSPIGVTIVGGQTSRWTAAASANVAKREIVSCLQVVFQNKRFKIPSDLPLLSEVKKEFLNFKAMAKRRTSGVKFEARGAGIHDDIVMSIGVALWYVEGKTRAGSRLKIIGGR